ncbi:hypothetical protein [Massilia horti]|uniref:Uncharacterized protein n=1 Tax=Massilia horti TaxID=2562153 RepID=A0A4Y9T2H4_9BURK|nr:hypothetical protein [Massilia horti]TFW32102.1 hypothetical protein E4O92_10945 [Massilia horti]
MESKFDLYSATQTLILELESRGDAKNAEVLKDAFEAGSTGSEICMALRFHISALIRHRGLTATENVTVRKILHELQKIL